MERQASSTTMLHIVNERKQDFFENQRQMQCSYFGDYCSKHGRDLQLIFHYFLLWSSWDSVKVGDGRRLVSV